MLNRLQRSALFELGQVLRLCKKMNDEELKQYGHIQQKKWCAEKLDKLNVSWKIQNRFAHLINTTDKYIDDCITKVNCEFFVMEV